MARAVYIIACETVANDSMTERMSFFHVLDGLEVNLGVSAAVPEADREQKASAIGVGFVVVSAWMRDPGEGDAEYEWEMWHESPDGHEGKRAGDRFRFTAAFHRLITRMDLHPRFKAMDGILKIVSRIRKVGDGEPGEWVQQDYPLLWTVNVNVREARPADQPSEPTSAE